MSTVNNKVLILIIFYFFNKKGVSILSTLDRIIYLLKQQNKKQVDLCNYLGIKKNAFTSWKGGRNKSYRKYISEIAEFLDVSADYLLGTNNTSDPEDALRFALFGGDAEYISDEAFEDVKRFAQIVAEKEKAKRNGK